MNSHTKSRLYLAAFAFVIFGTVGTCCYLEGGIHEHARQIHEQDAMISACREDYRILEHRYQSLADEADPITVIAAEAKYQEASR